MFLHVIIIIHKTNKKWEGSTVFYGEKSKVDWSIVKWEAGWWLMVYFIIIAFYYFYQKPMQNIDDPMMIKNGT